MTKRCYYCDYSTIDSYTMPVSWSRYIINGVSHDVCSVCEYLHQDTLRDFEERDEYENENRN